jgi:hypothetical protein
MIEINEFSSYINGVFDLGFKVFAYPQCKRVYHDTVNNKDYIAFVYYDDTGIKNYIVKGNDGTAKLIRCINDFSFIGNVDDLVAICINTGHDVRDINRHKLIGEIREYDEIYINKYGIYRYIKRCYSHLNFGEMYTSVITKGWEGHGQ